jgi:hypothetical protein
MLKSFINLGRASSQPAVFQWAKTYSITPVPMYNFASFQDKLEKRQQQMGEQEFKKEMDFLVNKPSFTLADYKQRILDGLTKLKKGLKAKLMTGNEATEANLMVQKKILNSFFDHELVSDKKLSGKTKQEIAVVSQTTIEDINTLLKNYEHLRSMHGWLKTVKENGEPLPQSQEELGHRFRRDRPLTKSYMKFKIKRKRYSRRMMRQRIKWGPKKKL